MSAIAHLPEEAHTALTRSIRLTSRSSLARAAAAQIPEHDNAERDSTNAYRMSVLGTLRQGLQWLEDEQIGEAIDHTTIDPERIRAGDSFTLYVTLGPRYLGEGRQLLSMLLGALIAHMTTRTRVPEHPTLVLADEAALLGDMQEVRTAAEVGRSFGIRLWTFWQSLAQMRRVYEKDYETLIENARAVSLMGSAVEADVPGLKGLRDLDPHAAGRPPDDPRAGAQGARDHGDPPVVQRPPRSSPSSPAGDRGPPRRPQGAPPSAPERSL